MTGTRSSAAFYADSLDGFLRAPDDLVYAPLTSPRGYTRAAATALSLRQLAAWRLQLPMLRASLWSRGSYSPTPTIIEAAQ